MDEERVTLLESGQAVVEYILILAVVVTVTISVLNNPKLRKLIGRDSEVFRQYGSFIQFTYRHTHSGSDGTELDDDYSSPVHRSYINTQAGSTRFFTPLEPIGNN